MKSYEIYKAFGSLLSLMESKNIPFQIRVKLAHLKKTLEPIASAYEKSEMDVANKYGDKNESGSTVIVNGVVQILDLEKKKIALEELSRLRNEEVSLNLEKIILLISECDDVQISALDVENLMAVIDFV